MLHMTSSLASAAHASTFIASAFVLGKKHSISSGNETNSYSAWTDLWSQGSAGKGVEYVPKV